MNIVWVFLRKTYERRPVYRVRSTIGITRGGDREVGSYDLIGITFAFEIMKSPGNGEWRWSYIIVSVHNGMQLLTLNGWMLNFMFYVI